MAALVRNKSRDCDHSLALVRSEACIIQCVGVIKHRGIYES